MTLFDKFISFCYIAGFIIVQIFTIGTEFSGTRTIVVTKQVYSKQIDTVTKDSIQKTPFETFKVKVKPQAFWDKLLLMDEDDNLLSLLLKIFSGFSVAWYIYQVQIDNVFSKKSLNMFWVICCFVMGVVLAHSIGLSHTNDFWKARYLSKGGTEIESYNFRPNMLWMWKYTFYFLFVFGLYKIFVDHQTEKINDTIKPADQECN